MSREEEIAIRFTPRYARLTGWPTYMDEVCDTLSLKHRSPTPLEFVQAVKKWQRSNPPLHADGILGPQTFAKMLPIAKRGQSRTSGTHLKPAGFLARLPPASKVRSTPTKRPAPPPVPAKTPPSEEDQLMAIMAHEAVNNTDLHVAYPVSAAEIAHQTKFAVVPFLDTLRMVVPIVKVGQIWPVPKGSGYRIVLGIVPPSIYFITDTGRLFVENAIGWADDYVAALYSEVAKSLEPLETMLEVEVDFLLGACSATGLAGVVIVVGGSAAQWLLANKKNLAKWINALETINRVRKELKALAPTFYDKVFYAILKNILEEIPESLVSNPKIMAKLIGQLLVAIGKIALKRDPSVVLDIMKPLTKELLQAIKAAAEYGTIAAAKAIPGAAKANLQHTAASEAEFVESLRQGGLVLDPSTTKAIMRELAANPQGALKLFRDFESAANDLIFE